MTRGRGPTHGLREGGGGGKMRKIHRAHIKICPGASGGCGTPLYLSHLTLTSSSWFLHFVQYRQCLRAFRSPTIVAQNKIIACLSHVFISLKQCSFFSVLINFYLFLIYYRLAHSKLSQSARDLSEPIASRYLYRS
jgi:hypothetical protein